MRPKLDGRFILIFAVLSVSSFLKVSGQSQRFPPSHLNTDFVYQNWTTNDGLPVNSISSITQHTDEYIWLGTADGLVRFDGIKFTVFNTSEYPNLRNNRIKGLASTKEGLLILNSNMEFLLYTNDKFQLLESPKFLDGKKLLGLYEMTRDTVSILTLNDDLFIYKNGAFEKGNSTQLKKLNERNLGDISWEAYSESLFRNKDKFFDIQDQINDVIVDTEGSLWLATFSKGLYQIKQNLFRTFSVEEGLPNRNVYPVEKSSDGRIWIGTHGGGIASLEAGKVSTGYLFEGSPSNSFVQSILQRQNGDLLVALLEDKLYTYTGDKIFVKYPAPISGTIFTLYESADQRLWIGSSSGLFFEEKNKWIHLNDPLISNATIKVIKESPDGGIWVGTHGQGLFLFKNSKIEKIDKNRGLNSNSIRSIWIDTTKRDDSYTLWIGTEDNGLNLVKVENSKTNPLQITSININEGLFDEVIHNIIPDDSGRVWMSSNKGIFWIHKNDVIQFEKGNIKQITSSGYTEKDGLRNSEANGGIQPAGFKDEDGDIWFPTQDGVVNFDPSLIKRNNILPQVYIEKVKSMDSNFDPVPAKIELEPGDRTISFQFTSLSFISPEKNRFKFRLFNFEEDWTETSNNREVRYTNLDPGTYIFKVIASNNDGLWNQQGAMVTIVIPSYFYESGWFYSLIMLFLILQIALVLTILKSKTEKVVVRKEAEIESLKKETDELKSLVQDQKAIKETLLFNLKEELKNPVTSLIEQVELEREPIQHIVERETKEMLSQIDKLILLSEIELSGTKINRSLENLYEIVKKSISLHKCGATPSDPVIEFSSNTEVAKINLDAKLATIIFRNLIREISRFKNVSRIRIQLIEESSTYTVKLTGDGEALTHDQLQTVFSLFKTKKQKLEHRNEIGIDLPLVAKLVELHNATIVVHSIPKIGNTFSVVFKKERIHFMN